MSNWGIVYAELQKGMAEVAIVGAEAEPLRKEMMQQYQPFALMMGTVSESSLALLEGKIPIEAKTTIYVCYNKACQRPVYTTAEAIDQIV
jgi:uncharacterized protein YyaL (SSP411 family)